ncbi:MAG TPA: enoyl-CoA hydratase-related protein [Burkholderiales bacterium]|nr:enoyl-CoA hydratase-related protein [Burkholderiales bacterium]
MVEIQQAGGVARIFLNRPEKSNAVNTPLLLQLREKLEEMRSHADLRVVVLAGRGKAFCGGADVTELATLDATNGGAFVERIHRVCAALRALPVPVVAKLHGAVIGAGLEIAAACDLRVAAPGTKFAMPEVRLGIPSVVEAALLPRLMGAGRAAWLVLTGDFIDAARARDWGLVEEVGGDEAVEKLVESLLAGDREALRQQKALCQLWDEAPLQESVARSVEAFGRAFRGGNTISSRLKGKRN